MAGLPADSKKAYLLINICHTRMTRPMAGIDGGFMALYLWHCMLCFDTNISPLYLIDIHHKPYLPQTKDIFMTQHFSTEQDEQGLTPIHRQNMDEQRAEEVLVENSLDGKDYPTIHDIADDDAIKHSHQTPS